MGRWFWNMGYRYICALVLGLTKISWRACLLFHCFFVDKNIAFKSSFDRYFHSLIIKFFWFAWLQFYSSESTKRCTLKLFLMSLETLRKGFLRQVWEGISRKLWFLVKLYQRVRSKFSYDLILPTRQETFLFSIFFSNCSNLGFWDFENV